MEKRAITDLDIETVTMWKYGMWNNPFFPST